jgi:hypothetical protein
LALPHLIKFVYNNGTDEVIRRGKKIHSLGYVELVEHDELMSNIVFRVRDDVYNTFYKVYIEKYGDAKAMSVRCSCPYNLGEICRHEAAGLLRLQDMVDKNLLRSSVIQYDQTHSVAKMKNIDLKMIKMLSSPSIFQEAETLLQTHKAKITKAEDERVEAELVINGEKYPLVIQKNDERNFDTSCMCSESMHPLCEHKTMLFLQLLQNYGPNYFDTIRNWDKEKNKLLQIYGYNLSEDLTGKFEFTYKDGKPFLKVLDTSIKRVSAPVSSSETYQRAAPAFTPVDAPVKIAQAVQEKKLRLGIVFNFNAKNYPGFTVDLVQGEPDEDNKKFLGKTEKIDLTKFVDTEALPEDDKLLFQQVRKLQESEINKYLNRNSPFSGIWENIIHTDGDDLPEETKALITEYLHPKLKKIFDEQSNNPFVFILFPTKQLKTANLKEAELSNEFLSPVFKVLLKKASLRSPAW